MGCQRYLATYGVMHACTLHKVSSRSNRTESFGQNRPGDIYVAVRLTRESGTRYFYDITVINSLTESTVLEASHESDPVQGLQTVLNAAYSKKFNKHSADVI